MASIVQFPTEKDRDFAQLKRLFLARGLSIESAVAWVENDVLPRLESLGLPYDMDDPVVRQIVLLGFELYCAKHGMPCDRIISS